MKMASRIAAKKKKKEDSSMFFKSKSFSTEKRR